MKCMGLRNSRRLVFLCLVLTSLFLTAVLFPAVSLKASGSPTTTTLIANPTSTLFGDTIFLTATVTSSSGTPTGSVEFFEGVNSLGTASLVGGTASKSIFTLEPGGYFITASYSGDANFAISASDPNSTWVWVMFKGTQTTLTVAPETSNHGHVVTFTAIVNPSSPGNITPSGSVDFNIQGDQLNRNITGNLDVSGTSIISLSDLPAGDYLATASYGGMIGYFTSISTEFLFHVNASGPVRGVGGDVHGINRPGLLIPWIPLFAVLIVGGVFAALRRRGTGQ